MSQRPQAGQLDVTQSGGDDSSAREVMVRTSNDTSVTDRPSRDDAAVGPSDRGTRGHQPRAALKAAGVISSSASPNSSRCVPRRSNAQARYA
jgi:hypothetical protein